MEFRRVLFRSAAVDLWSQKAGHVSYIRLPGPKIGTWGTQFSVTIGTGPPASLRLTRVNVEDIRVGVLEECGVERADGFVGVVFVDHEAHIDFACALRDHANVNVADGVEDLRGHAALPPDIV